VLVALDRDTPQTKKGLALPTNSPTQEPIINQEPPWLWLTLPELGFPLLMDQYGRPLHPEIEDYMRRYVSNDQNTRGIQPLPSHPSSRTLEEERKESGEKKQRLHNQWSSIGLA